MSQTKQLNLTHPNRKLQGEICLPASKSESNRALIIQALTQGKAQIKNLSEANDTRLLQQLLTSTDQELNAEDAGTAMRFLTAFLAITNQQKTLTGTARMQQRPIGLLVDALRELGADIEYLNHEGYPPLKLNGIDLSWPAQEISVPGHISSQFVSALLLVAPMLPLGLRVHITGHIASRPYIDMTLNLMRHFGASFSWEENTVVVEPVPYRPTTYVVPADWSSAGYWFSLAALAEDAEIRLPGLFASALHADKVVVEIARHWGVETTFSETGATLRKLSVALPKSFAYNFSDCPDLAPTILVLAAATDVTFTATGLESLKIKETDRVAALQTELAKIGASLQEKEGEWLLMATTEKVNNPVTFKTYSDHRMAMSFAPLALMGQIQIEQPETVRKSYPGFWDDLKKVGFELTEA